MDEEPTPRSKKLSKSTTNRKSKRQQRNEVRGDARQQATLAQRLSEFNLEDIVTTTSEGTALIETLKEATRIALASETTHTIKMKEYEDVKKEYGDLGEVNMSDLVAIARASLVQMAINELATAEENINIARAQLEEIRCDLKNPVDGGTETSDSLIALMGEIRLED